MPSWAQAPTLQQTNVSVAVADTVPVVVDQIIMMGCAASGPAPRLDFVGAGCCAVNGQYQQIEHINGGPAYTHVSGMFVIRRSTNGFWILVTAARKMSSHNCLYWHPSKQAHEPPFGGWQLPAWVKKHLLEDGFMPSWAQAPTLQQTNVSVAVADTVPVVVGTPVAHLDPR